MRAPVPYSPNAVSLGERLRAPDRDHWLGTDELGRDVLARVIHGARLSVGAGLLAALLALSVGVGFGALGGFVGKGTDRAVLYAIDVVQSVPVLVLVAAGGAFFPAAFWTAPLLIGLTGWTDAARLSRSIARNVRSIDFVEAVRAAGSTRSRIFFRHALPHSAAPALALAPYVLASAVAVEASISFLGLGVPPPTPSWGRALAEARSHLADGWWCAAGPGGALFLLLWSARSLGEALSALESGPQE
jgi:peptide/nickel transport system permease protein